MSSRYYEDKEAEIVPGKISDELRAALNLAENDVPVWIYRMRALGYPPGWLKKAIVDTSDIFDTDEPKAEGSSGKRKNVSGEHSVQYDHSKLIEYPGFNTPMPPDAHDYHYYHNMPAMLAHQQLDYAKKTMNAFTPAPMPAKRIRTASPSSNNNTLNSSLGDKTNASHDNTTASNDLETPASPDPSNDREDDDDDDNDVEDGNTDGSPSTDDNNLDKTSTESVNTKEAKSESTTPASKAANQSTSSITGEIKLVSKGSPMPQNVKRLPLERFSEGVVGDILYFENIPSSTGKFESIRGLLNTMRRSKSETDTSFGATSMKHNASSNSLGDEEGQDR